MPDYTSLHAPIIPVLRQVLRGPLLGIGDVALDLACGAGEKLGLLREAIGPHAMLLALDQEQVALRMLPVAAQPMQADAQALPLRDGCCRFVACVAALGLFADPLAALCETRRVLHAEGRALVVTSHQAWAHITDWPPDVLPALSSAYEANSPLNAHADVVGNALDGFFQVGFSDCQPRAFLLSPEQPHAELALLPWRYLAPQIGQNLSREQRAACAAAPVELEWCSLAIAVTARRT